MTKTFTLNELKAKKETAENLPYPEFAEPSATILQTILNYSRNLEIRPSGHVGEIQFIKS